MKDPTTLEQPCGRRIEHVDYPDLRCNVPVENKYTKQMMSAQRCSRCVPLGEQMTAAAYSMQEFSGQEWTCLAWNLTLASLLGTAANEALRKGFELAREHAYLKFDYVFEHENIAWGDAEKALAQELGEKKTFVGKGFEIGQRVTFMSHGLQLYGNVVGHNDAMTEVTVQCDHGNFYALDWKSGVTRI